MAIYHLRVKFVKRSEGRSATAAAAYRSGDKIECEREGKTHDYSRKQDIEHTEVILPSHVPETMQQRATLWNAIETGIKHPRGQPAMEVEAALPRELSKAQCVELCRSFANDMFVERGMAVDFAIHRTTASDGGEHPHVHFLISTRHIDENGVVGKAAREMQDNPKLVAKVYSLEDEGKIDEAIFLQKDLNLGRWRKSWEDYSNRFLDEAGSDAKIDHRTLAAQEIDREATPNIGFAFYGRLKSFVGHIADRVKQWQAISFRNSMREQMDRIKEHKPDLTAEFIAHAREYAHKLFPELGKDEHKLEKGIGLGR